MLDLKVILNAFGYIIYGAMAVSAIYGLFCVVMLFRRIKQKKLAPAEANVFLDEVDERLDKRDYDGITEMCDSPDWWSKAVAQLMIVAIENRHRPPKSLQRLVAEKYERDIVSDLDNRNAWVGTIVKAAPMLGLLGTVSGMISAFQTIAGAGGGKGVEPEKLAADIGFALWTTAGGLSIAIPLVILGNMVTTRMSRLSDSVQEQLGEALEKLDEVQQEDEDRQTS